MKKEVIGRNEIVDLPELELFGIKAKIDTGAYTSALHYHHAEIISKDGKELLTFKLLDPSHPEYQDRVFAVKHFRIKKIKNSFGQSEERYIIKTTLRLFGKDIETEFSLSNRGKLKFPVLLGRKLLNKHFLVDTSEKNLSQKSKNQ